MTQQEIANVADKFPMSNERTQLTYFTGEVETGHFYNNRYSKERENNLWNFVIMKETIEHNINKVVNGNDIESIKTIRLF